MSGLAQWIIIIPAVLWAITIHEFSHGYVAYMLGDPTPKLSGRLTLNPVAHLDPIGTVMLVLVKFGWAKPVPVNPLNFKKVDRMFGMLLVALAGPFSNFLSAFFFLIAMRILPVFHLPPTVYAPLALFLQTSVIINVAFGVFNLLPIPPLDGYRILAYFLPTDVVRKIEEHILFFFPILIVIVFLPGFVDVLWFFVKLIIGFMNVIISLF